MKELLVISGKGGTGKTSITASFAHLAKNIVLCDLDVDAPDIHLLLQPRKLEHHEFWSGNVASINESECSNCGACIKSCRFDAIKETNGQTMINPISCEGCKLCVELCPCKAIDFRTKQSGNWYLSQTRFGPFIHAQLLPAEENSGRLISLLRKQAKKVAKTEKSQFILCDGPPGIGCPVISSLSGTNLAVIVTEPTTSGLHDLARVLELCGHFKIPAVSIINKYDISLDASEAIEIFCKERKVKVIGKIPFDERFIAAVVGGKVVTELENYKSAKQMKQLWNNIISLTVK